MYHFIGYLVKNQVGDVVHFAPTRVLAETFCQQNNIHIIGVTQVYEWKMQPVIDVPDTPSTEQ
jgi:hypothetical protein